MLTIGERSREEQTQQWWNIEAILASIIKKRSKIKTYTVEIFSASHFAERFAYEYVARCFCKVPCV